MEKDLQKYVTGSTNWICLEDIPSSLSNKSETFWGQFSEYESGVKNPCVYQVAHGDNIDEIGNDLIHDKIGYTGKSSDVKSRVYDLRTSQHTCGEYRKQVGFELKDLFVRVQFCKDGTSSSHLEREIHNLTENQTGNRFAWMLASSGNAGAVTKVVSELEKMDLEQLKEIQLKAEQITKNKLYENFMEA